MAEQKKPVRLIGFTDANPSLKWHEQWMEIVQKNELEGKKFTVRIHSRGTKALTVC